jgi:hypothetical protein
LPVFEARAGQLKRDIKTILEAEAQKANLEYSRAADVRSMLLLEAKRECCLRKMLELGLA